MNLLCNKLEQAALWFTGTSGIFMTPSQRNSPFLGHRGCGDVAVTRCHLLRAVTTEIRAARPSWLLWKSLPGSICFHPADRKYQRAGGARLAPLGCWESLNVVVFLGRNGILALGTGKVWEGNVSTWCQREPHLAVCKCSLRAVKKQHRRNQP